MRTARAAPRPEKMTLSTLRYSFVSTSVELVVQLTSITTTAGHDVYPLSSRRVRQAYRRYTCARISIHDTSRDEKRYKSPTYHYKGSGAEQVRETGSGEASQRTARLASDFGGPAAGMGGETWNE